MARAIKWGVEGFRAAGVEVHTEKYQLPVTWSEGETRVELLGEIKFPLRAVSLGWSPATPAGGIEAPWWILSAATRKISRRRAGRSKARFCWRIRKWAHLGGFVQGIFPAAGDY